MSQAAKADGVRAWALPRAGAGARAFTLIELLLTVLVIAVLMSILLVAVNFARVQARTAADGQTVAGLRASADLFRSEFGFQLPLVYDGGAMNDLPGDAHKPERTVLDRSNGGIADVAQSGLEDPVVRGIAVGNPGGGNVQRLDVLNVFSPAAANSSATHPSGLNADARFLAGAELAASGSQGALGSGASVRYVDTRYSKSSLAYLLLGAGPDGLDGFDGPGFADPLVDGSFKGVLSNQGTNRQTQVQQAQRGVNEPLFELKGDTAELRLQFVDELEYLEVTGRSAGTVPASELEWQQAIVDRNGRAFRYYAWEPDTATAGGAAATVSRVRSGTPSPWGHGLPTVATEGDLNIPPVLYFATEDDSVSPSSDPTAGNAGLKGARWAIVGAGENGLFGTEPLDEMARKLGIDLESTSPSAAFVERVRREAAGDNIVEVGS